MVIFQALVGCHGILILGKSPIKLRQRPDIAVDWDVITIIPRNDMTEKLPIGTCLIMSQKKISGRPF